MKKCNVCGKTTRSGYQYSYTGGSKSPLMGGASLLRTRLTGIQDRGCVCPECFVKMIKNAKAAHN